jgi:phosphinothricin acetyltransferase
MIIRDAASHDVEALTAIHNDAVEHTTAIWDESPVSVAERSAWLAERQGAGFPVLVAEVDGAVGGYATYGAWRPKTGYRHTVEGSVYVLPTHRGLGLASALVDASVRHARAAGFHRMVAMIESGNSVSADLHARRGFEVVGRMDQVGRKFDRWLDLTVMQLRLDS